MAWRGVILADGGKRFVVAAPVGVCWARASLTGVPGAEDDGSNGDGICAGFLMAGLAGSAEVLALHEGFAPARVAWSPRWAGTVAA